MKNHTEWERQGPGWGSGLRKVGGAKGGRCEFWTEQTLRSCTDTEGSVARRHHFGIRTIIVVSTSCADHGSYSCKLTDGPVASFLQIRPTRTRYGIWMTHQFSTHTV